MRLKHKLKNILNVQNIRHLSLASTLDSCFEASSRLIPRAKALKKLDLGTEILPPGVSLPELCQRKCQAFVGCAQFFFVEVGSGCYLFSGDGISRRSSSRIGNKIGNRDCGRITYK